MSTSKDSWLYSFPGFQYVQSFGKDFLARILRAGQVPKHIAFVMDGNRRYAKRRNQETREGHNAGFESLSHILELCYNVGVECVTIFAFSIENFKRSPYEVHNLMELTKARLEQICERGDLAEQYGIKVKILGDTKLLKPDVQEVIERTIKITENNTKYALSSCWYSIHHLTVLSFFFSRAVLNVCFPYTSRDDLTTAVQRTVHSAGKGSLDPSQISEETLESNMYLAGTPKLDILIRTSGVERLSDFMLWQAHERGTMIEFIPTLWPEFSPWDMFWIIIKWGYMYNQYHK